MTGRNQGLIIVLFGLSLLLGILFGVLAFNGLLPTFSLAVPFLFAIALFALASAIAVSLAVALRRTDIDLEDDRRGFLRCARELLMALAISAVIFIILLIIFISVPVLVLLNAILIGFIATFLFFTLFLLAALTFCLIEEAFERRCENE